MISNRNGLENIQAKVFRSTEKVMPVDIEKLRDLLRERGRLLATSDQISFCYANDAAFRSMMYNRGWALTSQVGIASMEYVRINPNGGQNYKISRGEFSVLSSEERAVLLPGKGIVLASNTYFEDKACLVLRADITEQKSRGYLYTLCSTEKSRTMISQMHSLSVR